MKKLRIITKTEKGKRALERHVAESINISKDRKVMLKLMGYRQDIISTSPYTLEIEIKNKMFQQLLKPRDFMFQIDETMLENEAIRDIDYILEVEE